MFHAPLITASELRKLQGRSFLNPSGFPFDLVNQYPALLAWYTTVEASVDSPIWQVGEASADTFGLRDEDKRLAGFAQNALRAWSGNYN